MANIKIIITKRVYQDLGEIEEYLGKTSPKIGRQFVNKVFRKIDLLYDFPEIGRAVPEFRNSLIRELIQGKYRIIYHIKNENLIEVIRVTHGSRLIDLE